MNKLDSPHKPLHAEPSATASVGRGIFSAFLMLVPLSLALAGAWVGSSLTVYHEGPLWLALVGAVVVFGVLPLLWELAADAHQEGGRIRDAILRSSFLSAVFIGVLVFTHPESTYKALATRGDWFLAGSTTPAAQSIRGFMFRLADGFEWLHDAVRDKPFRDVDDGGSVDPGAPSSWVAAGDGVAEAQAGAQADAPGDSGEAPEKLQEKSLVLHGVPIPGTDLRWPLPRTPHPAAGAVPDTALRSPSALGKWLKAEIADPVERVRALHDVVATRIRYDFDRIRDNSNNESNQAAAVVLKTGLGVCAGYANLIKAAGSAAGLEVVRLSGDSRNLGDYGASSGEDIRFNNGGGHAWNAVRIDGRWFFIDATWDAGHGTVAEGFTADYRTTYLFTPPDVMILTHRPDATRWQHLETPLSRADWLRQPYLRPRARELGLSLEAPDRPFVPWSHLLEVKVDNPLGVKVKAHVERDADGKVISQCDATREPGLTRLACRGLDARGAIAIFAGPDDAKRLDYVGGVLIDAP